MASPFAIQVFFYGTLLDDATRKKALGRHVEGRRTTLTGWVKKTDKGKYPYLERNTGDQPGVVHGKVFELTEDDVAKLDAWEAKYYRIVVKLRDGTKAQVYEEAGH